MASTVPTGTSYKDPYLPIFEACFDECRPTRRQVRVQRPKILSLRSESDRSPLESLDVFRTTSSNLSASVSALQAIEDPVGSGATSITDQGTDCNPGRFHVPPHWHIGEHCVELWRDYSLDRARHKHLQALEIHSSR